MKRLIMLVGLPASGKSTAARKLARRGFTPLSADSIRRELYGDAAIQGDASEVLAVFDRRLDELLAKGADIVVDNTNVWPDLRKPILDRARVFGYTDIAIYVIDTPLIVCLYRNYRRERVVALKIILELWVELRRCRRSILKEAPTVRFLSKRDVEQL
jgi:predicted kinase